MMQAKPFAIPKRQVLYAYELVKANKGSAGIDQQSLSDFEQNLEDNLFRILTVMAYPMRARERLL